MWSKKDSIHISSDTQAQTVSTPVIAVETQYIDYVITQTNTGYTLNGQFTSTQQQALFSKIFDKARQKLTIENTSTNETLVGDRVIEFTNSILPHFIQTYKNGKIVYHNQKLTISGTADSYEAQHHMQALLNRSTLASLDNSTVAIAVRPIQYNIEKDTSKVHIEGIFNDEAQISSIKSHLPDYATTDLKVLPHHADTGSLPVVENFLPFFLHKYSKGNIAYANEKLTVSGYVGSEADLAEVEKLLSITQIPITNNTQIDPVILAKQAQEAKRKAKEEASQKARLEEEAKKAQEAEAARLAALKAQRKAEAEAAQKARLEEEAKKAQEAEAAKLAALEAQRKAEAEAAQKARLKEAEMKAKIAKLFELENIEFNVNKSTLTQKGQNTVNKLAAILKEYPSVHVEIGGHTDSDGSAAYNQKLSQSRVDMVKSKLIEQSIDASRLTAKGYGEVKPLVPNTTRTNKARNRRVEITILGE